MWGVHMEGILYILYMHRACDMHAMIYIYFGGGGQGWERVGVLKQ